MRDFFFIIIARARRGCDDSALVLSLNVNIKRLSTVQERNGISSLESKSLDVEAVDVDV
jgi:hypothetical protein